MTRILPDPERTLTDLREIISYLGPHATVIYVCSNWREATLARNLLYAEYPANSNSSWNKLVYPHMLLKFASVSSFDDCRVDAIFFDHNADPGRRYSWNKQRVDNFRRWAEVAHTINSYSDFPLQF